MIGHKWASVTQRKLAPGEKRRDPVEQLLEIADEIRHEEAEALARQATVKKTENRKAA